MPEWKLFRIINLYSYHAAETMTWLYVYVCVHLVRRKDKSHFWEISENYKDTGIKQTMLLV